MKPKKIKVGDTVVTHHGAGALLKAGLIAKVLKVRGKSLFIQFNNDTGFHVQESEVDKIESEQLSESAIKKATE